MGKKRTTKFWIIFWVTAAIFLAAWFLFWQSRFNLLHKFSTVKEIVSLGKEYQDELKNLLAISEYFLRQDDKEKVFLLLFENNMELRPGGGYIGSFGILRIKNGKVVELQTHDVSNFEGRIPDIVEPPYPMKETLHINSWKLRDSNYSPDFPTNAKKAEEFYYMGQGGEKFEGVIGITANVLSSVLKIIGPIKIEGYPGVYDSENAVLSLEYQVEKGYAQQGMKVGERKSVMGILAEEIRKRVMDLDEQQKIELAKIILEDLRSKDIKIFIKDEKLQEKISQSGWSGEVDQDWQKDYLLVVDANLGAYKSDYFMKRSIDYTVDLSQEKPVAKLIITYHHTAKQKDWMTNDYTSYLRVYLPKGFWLEKHDNLKNPRFASELGKKYFGFLIFVPIGEQKKFEFEYTLPASLKDDYKLKIQKQAGVNNVLVKVHIIKPDGQKKDFEFTMNKDIIIDNI